MVLLGLSQQEMQHLEQLRMLNQQQLSLMQLRRLEQNQLLLEHRPQACTLPPAHPLDLQACAPAAAAAERKRGRAAGREGVAAGNWKGGPAGNRKGGEGAAELQQWRRLLQLDGRGEKSACVLLTSE